MKQMSKRILTVSALAMAVAAPSVSAANWSDTSVGFRYGTMFTEPYNAKKITKRILNLSHASGYDYGQNFFSVDYLQSDANDPANNINPTEGRGKGATEVYITYRHQLHLGKIFDADLSFGPVKEVALTAGFDANTKNTAFAPRKRMLVVGPTLKFDVPKGFVDFSVLYAHERNHNAFKPAGQQEVTFSDYTVYNLAWGVPFDVGPVPMKFQGFANYNTVKGQGTTHEKLVRTSLMVDVGHLAFNKSNTVWAGVGFEYWRNKFGNRFDATQAHPGAGLDTNALTANVEWHF